MKIIKYALAGFLFVMGAYFLFNTFIKEDAMPKVKLTTSYGDIVLELEIKKMHQFRRKTF